MHSYSYNLNCDMNEIVRVMFPVSNISNRNQMDADKIRYLVNWGLAPYFKDKLVEDVSRSKFQSVIVCTSRVFNAILIDAENKLSLMKMMKRLTQQLHMLDIISVQTSVIILMSTMKILSNPILIQFCTRMVIVWMTFFYKH